MMHRYTVYNNGSLYTRERLNISHASYMSEASKSYTGFISFRCSI